VAEKRRHPALAHRVRGCARTGAQTHLLRLWLTAHERWSDGDAFLQQGIPKKDGTSADAAAVALEDDCK